MSTQSQDPVWLEIVDHRRGFLYLRGWDSVLRLAPWPAVTLEKRNPNGCWGPLDHELQTRLVPTSFVPPPTLTYVRPGLWFHHDGQMVADLGLPSDVRFSARASLMAAKYLAAVPPSVVANLNAVPQSPFGLLQLLARVPEAADLLPHDPNIALLLANERHRWPNMHTASWDDIALRMRGKRSALLGWIGLPARESTRALLRKIDPADLHLLPDAVESIARPDVLHALLNSRTIHSAVLKLLGSVALRPMVSAGFVSRLGADPERSSHSYWWLEQMDSLVRCGVLPRPCPRILDALVGSYGSFPLKHLDAFADQPFPGAPFLTGPELVPIESVHALIHEGHEMQHCAGTTHYVLEVLNGRAFFYKVLSPVRATLRLDWWGGAWRFGEIGGYGNMPLTRHETLTALRSLPASHWIVPYAEADVSERQFPAGEAPD